MFWLQLKILQRVTLTQTSCAHLPRAGKSCWSSQPLALLIQQTCCWLGIWGWLEQMAAKGCCVVWEETSKLKELGVPEQGLNRAGRCNGGFIGDFQYPSAARKSQKSKIIERFDLGGTLKLIASPAMSRDTSFCPRLLQGSSNLPLHTPRASPSSEERVLVCPCLGSCAQH